MMNDYKAMIKKLRQSAQERKHFCINRGTNVTPNYIRFMFEAADAIEQLVKERDVAIDCIYAIEDALDRGNDNDWAREHIDEWRGVEEDNR